jgi:nicotinate phosphoribosyltransferase
MKAQSSALLTDLYALTMAEAYFELDMHDTAVFELFVRRLPGARRFLVAAGLEAVVDYLENLQFRPEDLEFLAQLEMFSPRFLDHLSRLRFSGSLHAMPEGTPLFADEPMLRITAPILEAQFVESRVINLMHFQTMVASKAARCVAVGDGHRLIDFGMRRAHGAEAAVNAARAAFLAGFDGTATVEAGRRFGIPVSGTMAHSFIEAHDEEEEAFRRFARAHPHNVTLLIDTYDTERGARRAARIAREMPGAIRAVRIDSGDLAAQTRAVRRLLDDAGSREVQIVLSGNLDEYRIQELLRAAVPADAFGIGTHLTVSQDAPSLDMAYKLQDYAGVARLKRSPGKETWPGTKQVSRERDAAGLYCADHVSLAGEATPGAALLEPIMRDGRRLAPLPSLTAIQAFCREQCRLLPPPLRAIERADSHYPVKISDSIRALAQRLAAAG